jgi:adhesin transport system membrane fusion protein
LALVKSEIASVEPLVKAGLAPETRLITLQRELEEMSGRMDVIPYSIERIQKAIQEIDQQVESEKQGYQTQALTELSQVNIEIEDLSARLPAIVERMKRQTVLSPISGVINRITYQSSDAFVRSGDVLTEIVPADDSLIVEGKIDPKDIAKIKQGDDVKISLTAYDPSKFGRVDGSIRTISADAISNPDTGEQYYSVDIEVSGNLVDKAGKSYPLLPGMVATIEILAGKRTILDYFWQPITKGKDAAFRE